jgi:putative NADH-flavin reductase
MSSCYADTVTAISRNPPEKWNKAPPGTESNYMAKAIDIQDTKKLSAAFSGGLDAVVIAFAPPLTNMSELYEIGVEGHRLIKTALLDSDLKGEAIIIGMTGLFSVASSKVKTLTRAGGAGSLHHSAGHQLADQPGFCYTWW